MNSLKTVKVSGITAAFLFVVALLLAPSKAYAQAYSGPDDSGCTSQAVDYYFSGENGEPSKDIEQTLCYSYSDGYGLDAYVETEDDYCASFCNFYEYPYIGQETFGVNTEVQIVENPPSWNSGDIVGDSGVVYGDTWNNGQDPVSAETSCTPVAGLGYEIRGFYAELDSGGGSGPLTEGLTLWVGF